jgi:hypothetical protein
MEGGSYGERRHTMGGSGGSGLRSAAAPARQQREWMASGGARRHDRCETGESWGLIGGLLVE